MKAFTKTLMNGRRNKVCMRGVQGKVRHWGLEEKKGKGREGKETY
jgi:hypothetical protein